jgi:hypothetical protein
LYKLCVYSHSFEIKNKFLIYSLISNMKKTIIIAVIAVVVVGAAAFWGGMKYSQMSGAARRTGQGFQQGMGTAGGGLKGIRTGANFINGEIISKDDKSITVKMRDGGSKIIFLSNATEFSKFATGTAADLNVGTSVMANGNTNSDGSITAQSIQIRPQMASGTPGFGPGALNGSGRQ